jgi:radical SAM protein with 4Fe4S-binding SPASM domain
MNNILNAGRKFLDKIQNVIIGSLAYNRILKILENRPLDIDLELTNFCPQKCCFCCNKKIKRESEIMKMDLFRKICDDYFMTGGGGLALGSMQSDVFTDPYLLERLKYLKLKKDKFYLYTTNTMIGINKYDNKELKLILETFDYISVSVLGLNEQDFLKMSGIDGFKLFYDNMTRVRNMVNEYNIKIKIALDFRTHDKNQLVNDKIYKELVEYFELESIIDSYFSWAGAINQEDLPKGAKLITKNNLNETESCAASMSTLSITPKGKVIGCGCIDWNNKYIVGDLNNNTIYEIWNSDNYKRFRNSFIQKDIPEICNECALYTSIKTAYSRKALAKYKVTDGIYWTIR